MKKIVALLSALTLAGVMALTAFAEPSPSPSGQDEEELYTIAPDDDGEPDPESVGTAVLFSVNPVFTVTIPKQVVLSEESDVAFSIQASDIRLRRSDTIVVSIDENAVLEVSDGEESIPYSISKEDDTPVNPGSAAASFSNTDYGPDTIIFNAVDPDDIPYAGDFSGVLNFNIEVLSRE